MMARAEAANKAVAGVSTADELAKLQQLKDVRRDQRGRVRVAQGKDDRELTRAARRPDHRPLSGRWSGGEQAPVSSPIAPLLRWASRSERGLDVGSCRRDLVDRRLDRNELGAEARLIAEPGQRGLERLDGGQQIADLWTNELAP